MPIQFDKFDQSKIDRLKSHLEAMAARGKAKYYEIFVDSLKAIPKTDEPKEFDGYEDYMTSDTSQIKVVIYNSEKSPRNDQYVFSMKAKSHEEAFDMGLNGIGFRTFSKNELHDLREQREKKALEGMEIKSLKREIVELNNLIEEKDAYIEELEHGIETAKANGNKIGGMHIGEIVSVALEGLVRRNTHLIAKVPALNGLAGIIDKDNDESTKQISTPETEVSLKKKESNEQSGLTEQEKEFLNLYKEIQRHFNEDEINQVIEILESLSKDKSQISPVMELLQ